MDKLLKILISKVSYEWIKVPISEKYRKSLFWLNINVKLFILLVNKKTIHQKKDNDKYEFLSILRKI